MVHMIRIPDDTLYATLGRKAKADKRTLQDYVSVVLAEHCRLLPPGGERPDDLALSAYKAPVPEKNTHATTQRVGRAGSRQITPPSGPEPVAAVPQMVAQQAERLRDGAPPNVPKVTGETLASIQRRTGVGVGEAMREQAATVVSGTGTVVQAVEADIPLAVCRRCQHPEAKHYGSAKSPQRRCNFGSCACARWMD